MCHALESVHQHMLPFLRYSMQSVSHFNTESRCNYSMTLDDYTYCTCTNMCTCVHFMNSREHQVRSRTLPLLFLCSAFMSCSNTVLSRSTDDTGTRRHGDTIRYVPRHATPRHATPRHATPRTHMCTAWVGHLDSTVYRHSTNVERRELEAGWIDRV